MPPELDLTDPLRVLRVDQVARLLSIHPITVWKWSKQGRLPKPIKLGSMTTVWRATDLAKWLESKAPAPKRN
jgi:prophage regulatory protein